MTRWTTIAAAALLCACMNMEDSSGGDKGSSASEGGSRQTVNQSVSVQAGEKTGDVSTVNGSVRIANDAAVETAETVNGSITLGANSTAASLSTVNGGITLDKGARVAGKVATVNGSMTLAEGADVTGRLGNVNGHIRLDAAHVGGGITTTNGDIDIGANSRVEGGILVEKQSSPFNFSWGKRNVPRVVIGPGAVVDGTLRFERKVELYVSDTAKIGPVEGAEPVKFSGDEPPED